MAVSDRCNESTDPADSGEATARAIFGVMRGFQAT